MSIGWMYNGLKSFLELDIYAASMFSELCYLDIPQGALSSRLCICNGSDEVMVFLKENPWGNGMPIFKAF